MSAQKSVWYRENWPNRGIGVSLRVTATLHEERTACQKIKVFQTDSFGKVLVVDKRIVLCENQGFFHREMMVHPALFTHRSPGRVAILGFADCSLLAEVLKHEAVSEAWYVESDERVTRVAEQFFPRLKESNNHPHANFFYGTAEAWIADAVPSAFDLIIDDRRHRRAVFQAKAMEDFCRNAHLVLAEGGLLVQYMGSPLLPDASGLRQRVKLLRDVGFEHVHPMIFPEPFAPSGWAGVLLAGKQQRVQVFREEDATERQFVTHFYNEAVHRAALAVPEYIKGHLL